MVPTVCGVVEYLQESEGQSICVETMRLGLYPSLVGSGADTWQVHIEMLGDDFPVESQLALRFSFARFVQLGTNAFPVKTSHLFSLSTSAKVSSLRAVAKSQSPCERH